MLLYHQDSIKVVESRSVREILQVNRVYLQDLPCERLAEDSRCIFTYYMNRALLEMQNYEFDECIIKASSWDHLLEQMCKSTDYKMISEISMLRKQKKRPLILIYYKVPTNHPMLRDAKLNNLLI